MNNLQNLIFHCSVIPGAGERRSGSGEKSKTIDIIFWGGDENWVFRKNIEKCPQKIVTKCTKVDLRMELGGAKRRPNQLLMSSLRPPLKITIFISICHHHDP